MSYGDYPNLDAVERVLVVKLRHHGDVLLASPVFRVLRRALPEARIDAYIYREMLPMLEGHPDVAGFQLYEASRKLGSVGPLVAHEMDLFRRIRSEGYDLVINLTEGDRGALTAWFSGARYRIGWDPEGTGLPLKRKLYTHLVKRCRTPRHMVEQNLDALRRIGIFPTAEERDLVFAIPDLARTRVADRLSATGLDPGAFVLVHPTSRWLFKCWPASQIAGLIKRLHQAGLRVALSGAPDAREAAMIEDIIQQCDGVPVVSFAGTLTLKEVGALIAQSRCLVSVDSVPLHIASALRHPVVALFGPSSEQAWGPWRNPRGRVVALDYSCRPCGLDGCGGSKVSDCLHSIPVETVLAQVLDLAGTPA